MRTVAQALIVSNDSETMASSSASEAIVVVDADYTVYSSVARALEA